MPNADSPPVFRARGLTKKYGRRGKLALDGVDLSIPPGRVIGLVGPNGAGKSTLLHLACGLIEPTAGSLTVLGSTPAANASHLARVGFVAQNTPVYGSFTVAEHLALGQKLNPAWDSALAQRRIRQVGLNPSQKAGHLSGGQRAQLALTIAAAKRPELLIFDEPAAALDPLARQGFLQNLMEFVRELGASAVLSSHLLGDIEQVCDYLIVLCDSQVQLAGDTRDLLAGHARLVAPRADFDRLPPSVEVISVEHSADHSSAIVRTGLTSGPLHPVSLEELVLAYMTRAAAGVEAANWEVAR
ncbi:ABC transporter related protein [Kribbella flavida DSM 17836]|uniref:ABC transporter related protein n=1 Tax=Kribbella flavida (strain DSM 17836 / JCM 10339 / NBRC 14399) TaxID=479435 RepID=D2PWQ1_KRIFD|nr:ABC transporter ATP-binding protein [Kribbella flavida]ADB33520.1 ABC transporter related protein [Kribbella flavida DSM 17836]